ncbi:MAG: ImmA/IrrE family metallo-endopeptidase [Phycisphaerales bacterium]
MSAEGDMGRLTYWTNPSVRRISSSDDPVSDFVTITRRIVFEAMQKGWKGPPFDPFKLADTLHIDVAPTEDVLDARTVPAPGGKVRIEFNPNRPIARVRYSVAHEIAHTFFPDCREYVRERRAKSSGGSDEWQLEMLCNVGAAELLMPIGSFQNLEQESLNIDTLTRLRKDYDVSTEALLLRAIRLTNSACFVFCSSRQKIADSYGRYKLDYAVFSRGVNAKLPPGVLLPKGSQVENCTAIGYTAKGDEVWPGAVGKVHVECVGLPPYPGHRFPRVAGISTLFARESAESSRIEYVKGDATRPRGGGNKMIAFVINDRGRSWGAGFARAVQKKWPQVLNDFQDWLGSHPRDFALGNIATARIDTALMAVMMISQQGYGESTKPRIRYEALEKCLSHLAEEAIKFRASVHMPRIGSGQAGGSWWVIRELIDATLVKRGISVTVYELPESGKEDKRQMSFGL